VASLGDRGAAAPPVSPARRSNGAHVDVPSDASPAPSSDTGERARPVQRDRRAEVSRPARSRAKRALDLGIAAVTAPLVIPLGLFCAALIKLTSSGPVLFAQERVGMHGERFRMYKFRTMHVDAERLLQQDARLWQDYVDNGFKLPAELDSRVTALGRFLRRSSLDELPQMLNVLGGTMSLVGPRPVVPAELANYGDRRWVYLSARPGITGAWQVNGRSTVHYPERVDIDARYVSSWSLWLDVRILVRTPIAVLSARGAH
jgi:exopolysaccharide production protein ExoY